MGNVPSTERPSKASQKLLKPRVGGHSPLNGLLHPSGSSINDARSSNSYINTPILKSPALSAQTQPEQSPEQTTPESTADVNSDGIKRRESLRLRGLLRSLSSKSQPERPLRRPSTGNKSLNGVARAKSLVHRRVSQRKNPKASQDNAPESHSLHLEILSYEPGKPNEIITSTFKTSCTETHSTGRENTDQTRHVSCHNQVLYEEGDDLQTQSLFHAPPTRRSSMTQTPGVATRPAPTRPPISYKAELRKSLPTPEKTAHEAVDSLEKWRMSLPQHLSSTSREFVVTPSDSDYQQLGVMKFGSLRIMNGTPVSSRSGGRESVDSGCLKSSTNDDVHETVPESNNIAQSQGPSRVVVHDAMGEAELQGPEEPIHDSDKHASDGGRFPRTDSGYISMFSLCTDSKRNSAISRSDSGFMSTYASKSGLDQASRADGWYSSSVSLRSLSGSKNSRKERSRSPESHMLAGYEGLLTEHASDVPETKPSLPGDLEVNGVDNETSKSSTVGSKVTRSNSLLSRGSAFISSYREKRFKDGYHVRSRSKSSPSKVGSAIEPSTNGQNQDKATSCPPRVGDAVQKTSKLKRLLSLKRKDVSGQSTQAATPENAPMTGNANGGLRQHHADVSDDRQRKSASQQLEKETSAKAHKPALARSPTDNRGQDWEKNQATFRTASLKSKHPESLSGTVSSVSSTLKSSGRRLPSLRKSVSSVKGFYIAPEVEGEYDANPVHLRGHELQIASMASSPQGVGNSAFDQAIVSMVRDQGTHTGMRRRPPPSPQRMVPSLYPELYYPRLRPRRSVPDYLQTVSEPADPGELDSTQQKPPRTPPPVSLRTRGSKMRQRPRSRSQSQAMRSYSYTNQLPPMAPGLHMTPPYVNAQYAPRTAQHLGQYPLQPSKRKSPYDGFRPAHARPLFSEPMKTGSGPRQQTQPQTVIYSGTKQPAKIQLNQLGAGYSYSRYPTSPISSTYNPPVYRGIPIRTV